MADRIIEYQINFTIGASVYSEDCKEYEDGSVSSKWGRMKNINELIDYLKYRIYVDRSSLVVYKMTYELEPGIRYPSYDSDGKISGYNDSSRYRLVDKVKYYPKNSEIRESKTKKNTKRNVVKINENTIRQIVAESVKRALKEYKTNNNPDDNSYAESWFLYDRWSSEQVKFSVRGCEDFDAMPQEKTFHADEAYIFYAKGKSYHLMDVTIKWYGWVTVDGTLPNGEETGFQLTFSPMGGNSLYESKLRKIVAESIKMVLEEEGKGIHIKEKNRGKFNATKERTGKSTPELTHSENPLTRKRAIFAQNAKKWNKKK